MHVLALESRTLFATGLDPSFGSGGAIQTAGKINSALAIDGAIFVGQTLSDGSFIYKYDSAGDVDTSWGKNGRVGLSFTAKQIAYDKRNSLIYTAGSSADGITLNIVRLTAAGAPDTGFDSDGLATYTINDPTHTGAPEVERIIPLTGRRVLVAMQRTVASITDTSAPRTHDVALMRLRQNGTRDLSFGSHGLVTVVGGNTAKTTSGSIVTEITDVPLYGDIVPLDSGGFRVIASRDLTVDYTVLQGNTTGDSESYTYQVKDYTVTSAGRLDSAKLFSWTLIRPSGADLNKEFRAQSIVGSGGTSDPSVTVVGHLTTGSTATQQLYRVTPNASARGGAYAAGGLNLDLIANGSGGSVLAADGDVVTRLRSDYSIDRTFGVHGGIDLGANITLLTPDADGNVLAASSDELFRIA